jgi:hypothetical protein
MVNPRLLHSETRFSDNESDASLSEAVKIREHVLVAVVVDVFQGVGLFTPAALLGLGGGGDPCCACGLHVAPESDA